MTEHSTYLIIFEVEERLVGKVVGEIRALGDWGRLTPSAFMVATPQSAKAVIERLQPLIGPKDAIWVISPTTPWASHGDPIVEDHVESLLGPQIGDWIPKDWNQETGRRE